MQGKLIAVMGTNASGKSWLGIELAARYGGEVVSADSRQVFRGLVWAAEKSRRRKQRVCPTT